MCNPAEGLTLTWIEKVRKDRERENVAWTLRSVCPQSPSPKLCCLKWPRGWQTEVELNFSLRPFKDCTVKPQGQALGNFQLQTHFVAQRGSRASSSARAGRRVHGHAHLLVQLEAGLEPFHSRCPIATGSLRCVGPSHFTCKDIHLPGRAN